MANSDIARIRKFRMEDIDAILEIEDKTFEKTAYPREVFLEHAKRFPDNFVVGEVAEHVVGYMIFDTGGHILSTAVEPTHRRKGLGALLFTHALKSIGSKLWLEVRSKNTTAIEFYEKMGMKIVGKIPNYYEADDALIMALRRTRST